MKKTKYIVTITYLLLLNACATTPELSQKEIVDKYPAVASLGTELEKAKADRVDLFAPKNYEIAETEYKSANSFAQNQQNDATKNSTDTGMKAIEKANIDAKTSKNIFAEVINARQKAVNAGAEKMFNERLNSLDNDFKDASTLVEEGSIEQAKRKRPELQRAYSDLELVSLKQNITKQARDALAQAKTNDANRMSPKTYAQAIEEIKLAESILDTDRTDIDKANVHANRATILSDRSKNITELVKDFDRRDFSNEDIVLWHQNELASASSPLNEKLTFSQPNDETVNKIRQRISEIVAANMNNQQNLNDLKAKLTQTDAKQQQNITNLQQKSAEELANLDKQYKAELAKQEVSRAEFAAFEMAKESRFARVQEKFNDNEAKVYRQKNDVLLSVYGFDFLPGNADINPKNFTLMDKIVKSIAEFKNSKIVVSGHTDSTGTDEINQTLSQQRAQNVAKFLNEVGGISTNRLVAEGYGQSKPVASNNTPEGRALNRRVEVLIVNN